MWGLGIGAAALAIAGGIIFAVESSSGSSSGGPTVAGLPCDTGERLTYHVHAHLAIVVDGQPIAVPAQVGIKTKCLYWLHTHDESGIIHVEAPEQRDFTLGQFFQVWGKQLNATSLLDSTPNGQQKVEAFVDGKAYAGDPASIPLNDKTSIVLEYGPPFVPPPQFGF